MSTLALVLIVLSIAVTGVSALSFVRWREAKRLAYARQVVEFTDAISLLDNIGNDLQPWLSANMLKFISKAIEAYHSKLEVLRAPSNKKVERALNNALFWGQVGNKNKQPLPGNSHAAQNMREGVRSLLSALKDSYKLRIIDGDDVKSLLDEAKNLNIGITLAVYQEKAGAAEKMHNNFQAMHYLKKGEAFLAQQSELSSEHASTLKSLRERIKKHGDKIELERAEATSRLQQDAAKLSEEDDSWKKKRF